ncbi:TonB-dependent receptor [Novosphingobium sp.]|uniref:TonB-dependent receptor n=1 Tax=Novosphingobium sp. TaxID=1874826 RepID=UPI0031E15354
MHTALMSTVACLALVPGLAFAQSDAPSGGAAAGSPQLTEIIVTAQRREENLQRAAVAVDVVTGADLVAAGTTNASLLSDHVPALTVEPSSTGNLIFLRGVGNFTVVPTSDPAIAYNYDNVYVGRPTSTTGAFFDLSRVEVLKGPQGTLYGRNATGGAINVNPEHPHYGETSGYATASYGNYNAFNAEGAINLAMGQDGAARLSGTITRRDGYLKDGTFDDRTEGLRFQMAGRLTDRLTARIGIDYAHNGGYGYSVSYTGKYVLNPATARYSFVPSNIPVDQGLYTPASQAFRQGTYVGLSGRTLGALTPMPYQNNHFYGANAEITWKTDAGTLTFIPAWRDSKLDYSADAAAFFYKTREDDSQYSGELRFNGNRIDIFSYTLGMLYYHETEDYHADVNVFAQSSWTDQRINTASWAPFGRLTANLTDTLRLVGGIRYTHDHKDFVSNGVTGVIVCRAPATVGCPTAPLFPLVDDPSQLPFAFPPQGVPAAPLGTSGAIVTRTDSSYNSQLTNQRVTWRGAVEYDLTRHSLLYASVETGYRSGGFAAAVGHTTYQPETITAYTLGSKNRFFGNRLQLNIEGFLWNYHNQQVNHVGLDSNGSNANFTDNIGSSKIYGVEVETQALVTKNTLLSADIQYLHARNDSFVYTTGASAAPVTGCPYTLSGPVYVINCSGFAANNAPRWTMNLGAQQTIPVGDYKVVMGVDTQYKSGRFINFSYVSDGGGYVDHSWQTNAQISFGPANGRWSAAAFVRNIEDNRVPTFQSPAPLINLTVVGTTPPRTFGGRVSVKF